MEGNFRFIIQSKGVLGKVTLDFEHLLKSTNLCFQRQEGKSKAHKTEDGVFGLLYNPKKLARGIYYDGRKATNGKVTIGISFPCSEGEISDFFRVASEIKLQYRNIQIYHEDFTLSFDELVEKRESFVEYAKEKLSELASGPQPSLQLLCQYYTLTPTEQQQFQKNPDLELFSQILDTCQNKKFAEAAPVFFHEEQKEQAVFFLVEEQAMFFPLNPENSVYLQGKSPENTLVSFKNKNGKALLSGYYGYGDFVDLLLELGAETVDEKYLSLPAFTKDELESIVAGISLQDCKQFV